ncbi:MAG: S8 family peptidase, partial [Lachnospiraceae bacterium]|nr:S8 family peptidase [Lachnospiraceae bacterium]
MNHVKQLVHAEKVYQMGLTGKNVRIALLDTGAYRHPDIRSNVIYFKDYVNNRKESYDDNGHGTHILGILCGNGSASDGRIMGMAPKAEVMVFKILDNEGNGKTSDALDALDWILENHKRYNLKLLNFSMGYVPYANQVIQQKLLEKLDLLWEDGVTIVTAAGNNGPERNSITVPGISRNVITVGSSEESKYTTKLLSGYSGRGPTSCCIVKPEVLAPGTDVLSTSNRGVMYEKKSGTSMSAPIVTGALALAYEKYPKLTPVVAKLLLYDSVDRIKNNQNPSWGILNVDKLVEM